MAAQAETDTFSWIGASGSDWATLSDWFDQSVGAVATILPDLTSTVTLAGGTSAAPMIITVPGTGLAGTVAIAGQIELIGAYDFGTVSLTGPNEGLTLTGPTVASSGTIGTLIQTGAGDTISAIGLGTTLTIQNIGTITQPITASANAVIVLPKNVVMNGGTLNAGQANGDGTNIQIGSDSGYGVVVGHDGTLSGSGLLYGQYFLAADGSWVGSTGLTVDGTINSTGFRVDTALLGGGGTINVMPNGFFDAPYIAPGLDALTFTIGNGGSLHLPGTADPVPGPVTFLGSGGVLELYSNFPFPGRIAANITVAQASISFLKTIVGFGAGDRVLTATNLPGGYINPSWIQNGPIGTLELTELDGSIPVKIAFDGTHTVSDFTITKLPPGSVGEVLTPASWTDPVYLQIQTSATNVPTSPGSHAGHAFTLSNQGGGSWGDASIWLDINTGLPATVAPGLGDTATIVGATNTQQVYTVLQGTGIVGSVAVSGTVVEAGTLSAINLGFVGPNGNLEVANGAIATVSTLTTTGTYDVVNVIGDDSAGVGGALNVVAGATLATGGTLNALSGGLIRTAGLTLTGSDVLYVDTNSKILSGGGFVTGSISAITIGTTNDAAPGTTRIDSGSTLTDLSPTGTLGTSSSIQSDLIDDGTLLVNNLFLIGIGGTGQVTIAAGGTLAPGSLIAGATVGFTLGAGATLAPLRLASQDTGASIDFAGPDGAVAIGYADTTQNLFITGATSNFQTGDSFEIGASYLPGTLVSTANPIYSLSYVPSGPSGGTLRFLDQNGTVSGGLALNGDYAGDTFVLTRDEYRYANIVEAEPGPVQISAGTAGGDSFTYAGPSGGQWGDGANWKDTTNPGTTIAPGALDSVTVNGSLGSNGLTVLTGVGSAGTLSFSGTVAVAGSITAGTIALSGVNAANLTVDQGGTLTTSALSYPIAIATGSSFILADGAGALFNDTGTLSGDLVYIGGTFPVTAGAIAANGGTAKFGGFNAVVSGNAFPFLVEANGTIDLPATMPSDTSLTLQGTNAVLGFGSATSGSLAVAPSISGFVDTDQVDVTLSNAAPVVTFTSNGTVSETASFADSFGKSLGTLTFTGDFTGHSFHAFTLTTASAPTTAIALDVACFRAGTLIATPDGPVPVETLVEGDRVITASGVEAPVIWTGRRHIDCASHPRPDAVWPVRVRAGAFGPGRPARDLFLSPDHAVYVHDRLIPIKYLTNGTTIEQIAVEEVTYHHIELPEHDVLLAEGLPCGSFLDTGQGYGFSNRHGAPVHRLSGAREAMACAELVVTGHRLASIRSLLAPGAVG
jgi:collagen type I alpha